MQRHRENIEQWARDNYGLAFAVCQARALAECERKRVDHAHREHGFTGPTGYCPALLAEDRQRIAERALLKSGCEFVGLDHIPCLAEDRKRFLKILIGLCLCVQASDKNDKKRGLQP